MKKISITTLSGFVGLLSLVMPGLLAAQVCRPIFEHVIVVIEENHGFKQIIGNPNAPYINALAARGALFTNAHGVDHPSQANYVAWWSGSTYNIRDDVVHEKVISGANLGTRLATAGKLVKAVEEPPVVNKHAPWVSFKNNGSLVRTDQLTPPEKLNALTFIIPNQHNDMHSASVARGDAWLRDHLPAWIERLGPQDLLVLTFDEDDFTPVNHIPMLWLGPAVRPGRYGQRVDHYNVLRTVGQGLGIKPLTEALPINGVLDCKGSGQN